MAESQTPPGATARSSRPLLEVPQVELQVEGAFALQHDVQSPLQIRHAEVPTARRAHGSARSQLGSLPSLDRSATHRRLTQKPTRQQALWRPCVAAPSTPRENRSGCRSCRARQAAARNTGSAGEQENVRARGQLQRSTQLRRLPVSLLARRCCSLILAFCKRSSLAGSLSRSPNKDYYKFPCSLATPPRTPLTSRASAPACSSSQTTRCLSWGTGRSGSDAQGKQRSANPAGQFLMTAFSLLL